MVKVRLYEDIDCCLNASYNARAWRDKDNPEDLGGYCRGRAYLYHDDDGHRISEFHTPHDYRMEWNERLIAELNTLDVELVWATTWRADAPAVGELMGLTHEDQRVLHPLHGRTTFPSIFWKFDAILAEQDRDPGPFIAVDDEWDSDPAMRATLELKGGLVVCPDPNLGITPADVKRMREYVDAHA